MEKFHNEQVQQKYYTQYLEVKVIFYRYELCYESVIAARRQLRTIERM